MNPEQQSTSLTSSLTTENSHPISLPLFLTTSSSSLKPLRERNRTNSKRRIKLSRSQVLSNDFENQDSIPSVNKTNGSTTNSSIKNGLTLSNSQPAPSTPNPVYNELCSKVLSPTTPSPIHSKVTCSQVWERLASHDETQNETSPKKVQIQIETDETATSNIHFPSHISFSYDRSDDEENDDDKNEFQYVPLSSQSKLVQCQFLTFARQQKFLLVSENDESDESDEDEDENQNDDDLIDEFEFEQYQIGENQQVRLCMKRKREGSDTDSIERISSNPKEKIDENNSTNNKERRPKKVKTKDPNANFQRLNMRKKNFSQGKKHQFSKNKRNAFYRRMRNTSLNR